MNVLILLFYTPEFFPLAFPKNQARTKKRGSIFPSSYMVNHHIFKHVVKNIIFDEKTISIPAVSHRQ